MNSDHTELEYEVIKLIAALKNYQETKKGLFYLNTASDKVLSIIADRPGMLQLMVDLGLAPMGIREPRNHQYKLTHRKSGIHDK